MKLIFFLVFWNYFNKLISRIILKNKKYILFLYIFIKKKTLKNNNITIPSITEIKKGKSSCHDPTQDRPGPRSGISKFHLSSSAVANSVLQGKYPSFQVRKKNHSRARFSWLGNYTHSTIRRPQSSHLDPGQSSPVTGLLEKYGPRKFRKQNP